MKSNELRLGNWILDVQDNQIQVRKTYFVFMASYEICKPIPLTEEWLLKLGFIKHVSQSIWYTLNKVDVWFFDGKYVNDIDVEIKYVHQLQNLYFALTNEELTMK
jgi:hypothetical protein